MDDQQLRQSLGNPPPAKRGWFCPKDELLAGYAEGRLPSGARERVERHVAGCAFCRQQAAALVKLAAQPLPEVPPDLMARAARLPVRKFKDPRLRIERWALGLAAVLCVALVVAPRVQTVRAPATVPAIDLEAVRKSPVAAVAPEIEFPQAGAAVSAQELEFRWSGMQGGLGYQVQVITTEGDVKWQGNSDSTSLRLPANLLTPGNYYVSVAANLADGKSVRSRQVAFQISPGK
jgi:hypothetical protein